MVCLHAKIKVSGAGPEALTTGELRDRVFEMAKRASVKIKQVFVLGSSRMQVANAYATGAQTVMFTDYLLQRLTKREVDAIAGHELTHLRHQASQEARFDHHRSDPVPLDLPRNLDAVHRLISGVLMAISGGDRDVLMQWYRWSPKLVAWSQLDLVLIVAGFGVFYLLARRFERIAEEGSVQLSNDPEAMITAMLKLSRLNLTPSSGEKLRARF